MKYRFIKYQGQILVVKGITYNTKYDPPECYVATPLEGSLFSSAINLAELIIPIDKAEEVTKREVIETIVILYGASK